MRIALIAHTTLPWTGHYARYFDSRGHQVRVVSLSPEPLDDVDVEHVGMRGGLPRSAGYLASVPSVRRALRRFSPDVVFATYLSSNGMVAALARQGTPLVVSARGSDVFGQSGYLPGGRSLHNPMMRFVCRRAAAIHAVSDGLVEALGAAGVPTERISCFPIGIDVDRFPMASADRPAGEPPHIVCTRRQEEVYSNETLVEAFGKMFRKGIMFRGTLIGGGSLLADRRAQIRDEGLEGVVRCTGQLPLDEVGDLLRTSDVYVSASTSDGTSSSLLEAMATGLFPVATSIQANERWVKDGKTGLLFQAGQSQSLAEVLERALRETELRRAARIPNRAIVLEEGNQAITMAAMERLLVKAAG